MWITCLNTAVFIEFFAIFGKSKLLSNKSSYFKFNKKFDASN